MAQTPIKRTNIFHIFHKRAREFFPRVSRIYSKPRTYACASNEEQRVDPGANRESPRCSNVSSRGLLKFSLPRRRVERLNNLPSAAFCVIFSTRCILAFRCGIALGEPFYVFWPVSGKQLRRESVHKGSVSLTIRPPV